MLVVCVVGIAKAIWVMQDTKEKGGKMGKEGKGARLGEGKGGNWGARRKSTSPIAVIRRLAHVPLFCLKVRAELAYRALVYRTSFPIVASL